MNAKGKRINWSDLTMRCYVVWMLVLFAMGAPGAQVFFDLVDCISEPATNRKVLLLPLTLPRGAVGKISITDQKRFDTGTNGAFWASNLVAAAYQVDVQAPPRATRFEIVVPATNGVVLASAILGTGTNNVAEGNYAYSVSSSYSRAEVDALLGASVGGGLLLDGDAEVTFLELDE